MKAMTGSNDYYRFKLFQDGLMVAEAAGSDWRAVSSEASHYFAQYAQDGPTKLKLTVEKLPERKPSRRGGDKREGRT